jgi:hypothetical protein
MKTGNHLVKGLQDNAQARYTGNSVSIRFAALIVIGKRAGVSSGTKEITIIAGQPPRNPTPWPSRISWKQSKKIPRPPRCSSR